MASEYIPGLEGNTNERGEIACDIDNVCSINFTPDPAGTKVRREDVLDFGDEGFLLHDVLTGEESSSVIEEGERIGFERLKGANDNYRNQQRITVNSPQLADILWQRVKDFIQPITFVKYEDPKRQHIHGVPFVLYGKWNPVGFNNIFRLCRYFPGGHFAPHFDGFYMKNPNERSMKTFMIYLNDDFEDGSTNFVKESQTLYKNEEGKYCAQEENILNRIRPHPGMAIAFNHHRLHEGQQVRNGTKYILRTDVMYEKCGGKLTDEQAEGLRLIQEAERLEAMGEGMKAVAIYRKAFKIAPDLENNY